MNLPATLGQRFGLVQAVDELVRIGFRPKRAVATVTVEIMVGAECIDDVNAAARGATERLLRHKTMTPSTIDRWQWPFTFGHMSQLAKLAETMMTPRLGAWRESGLPL